MEFGKLDNIDNVDFSLPPDPGRNTVFLTRLTQSTHPPKIYVGATGYHMKPWVGTWYPEGTRQADFLRQYGLQFNTIEHNTTHYRIPDSAMVARWREETPDDFRFCPKIPQTISHAGDLGASNTLIESFADAITGLEEKYGCSFLQLPPGFAPHHLVRLERFLYRWPEHLPVAIEVRHPDYFPESPAFYELLEQHGTASVITDVAGRRDVCHMHLSTARTMVRFVGNALHPTDYSRIDEWGIRLKQWCADGIREVYFFTHEPDNLLAPDLAAYAVQVFQQLIPEAQIRGPKKIEPEGVQGTLF